MPESKRHPVVRHGEGIGLLESHVRRRPLGACDREGEGLKSVEKMALAVVRPRPSSSRCAGNLGTVRSRTSSASQCPS